MFDGDLNGEDFPGLQNEVNNNTPSSSQNIYVSVDTGLNALVDVDNEMPVSNDQGFISSESDVNKYASVVHENGNLNVEDKGKTLNEKCAGNENEANMMNARTLVDILRTNATDNKLLIVPTSGVEIAIFDEEIVELGSAKWDKTVCGQFLGCMVSFNEARHHLKRMWNKFGLKDMTVNEKGIFFSLSSKMNRGFYK